MHVHTECIDVPDHVQAVILCICQSVYSAPVVLVIGADVSSLPPHQPPHARHVRLL